MTILMMPRTLFACTMGTLIAIFVTGCAGDRPASQQKATEAASSERMGVSHAAAKVVPVESTFGTRTILYALTPTSNFLTVDAAVASINVLNIDVRALREVGDPVYVVEFRARGGSITGHTYVVFSEPGKPDVAYGVFPQGQDAKGNVLATFGLVPLTVRQGDTQPQTEVTQTIRVQVDSRQYGNAQTMLQQYAKLQQQDIPFALGNNDCVTFVSKIGTALDLRMPARGIRNITPQGYIKSMADTLGEQVTVSGPLGRTYTGTHVMDDTNSPTPQAYGDGTLTGPFGKWVGQVRDFNAGRFGTLTMNNGNVQKGDFNGRAFQGTLDLPNGEHFEGTFKPATSGAALFLDIGESRVYLAQGSGTFRTANGQYTGQMKNNTAEGNGVWKDKTGLQVAGTFHDGLIDGPSETLTDPSGEVDIAPFTAEKLSTGRYKITWPDGVIATGIVTDGIFGPANVTTRNGQTATGAWNGVTLSWTMPHPQSHSSGTGAGGAGSGAQGSGQGNAHASGGYPGGGGGGAPGGTEKYNPDHFYIDGRDYGEGKGTIEVGHDGGDGE